jgi:hypothetical protein
MADSTITPRTNDSIDWWMAENPEFTTANIGAFKQRLYCANNIDEIPLNTRKKQSKQLKARANLQTSNVTQTVLQTARDTCQGSPCGCRSTEHPNQSHLKIEQLQVPEKASSAPKS